MIAWVYEFSIIFAALNHLASPYRLFLPPLYSSTYSIRDNSENIINILTDGYAPKDDDTQYRCLLRNAPTVQYTLDELKLKWIDICIERSEPNKMDQICFNTLLQTVYEPDKSIEIISSESKSEEDVIYITELELKKLWTYESTKPMQKQNSVFDLESSLIMIDDNDEFHIEGNGWIDYEVNEMFTPQLKLVYDKVISNQINDEGEEIVITLQQLQQLWEDRSRIKWGLPSRDFDEKLSLLLIDEDNLEEENDIQIASGEEPEEYITTFEMDLLNEQQKGSTGYWDKFADQPNLQEALKRQYDKLEARENYRPAWKKKRLFMTTDIDTQNFMGDIMFSNTYLTTRIPANWDDPEDAEMSEVYLSTNSMTLPGEIETDYTIERTPWDVLNLEMPPPLISDEYPAESRPYQGPKFVKDYPGDWKVFNFSMFGSEPSSPQPSQSELEVAAFNAIVDTDNADTSADLMDGSNSKLSKSKAARQSFKTIAELATKNRDKYQGAEEVSCINWRTPVEWLTNPEFDDHVDYSVWAQYDENLYYGADNAWQYDDQLYALTMQHVKEVTDLYAHDELHEMERIKDKQFWRRKLQSLLFNNESLVNESIPLYFTPEIHEGIEYTDEILEMKSQMILSPKQKPLKLLLENDSFVHNAELEMINKIGTCRDQYDWSPRTDLIHEIEEEKIPKLIPVIRYINHAAVLQSTKDNIIIFKYLGPMRNIIGIRASMLAIAKVCYPEIVDLRLESVRMFDKFDV